jgi:lipoate-protein ligase A
MLSTRRLAVVPFEVLRAAANMALDARLLEECERDPGTAFLRFYAWSPPALSLGRFEAAGAIDADRARADGVDVVRRPTGGRVVLHSEDLTYTVVVARDRWATAGEAYAWISARLVEGLASLGADVAAARGAAVKSAARQKPCFLSAARHEIVHRGRKLVGSAQRLGRAALLQHGSLPVGRGYLRVVEYLAVEAAVREALAREMLAATVCLEDLLGGRPGVAAVAAALERAMGSGFGLPVTAIPDRLREAGSDRAAAGDGRNPAEGGAA